MTNPIYRSLTAEIECTMEGGKLYLRDCVKARKGFKRSAWRRIRIDSESAGRFFALAREHGVKAEYFWGCISHCMEGLRDSRWRHTNRSEELACHVALLEIERTKALMAEAEDRPVDLEGEA